jgi:hypothetical protein
MRLGICILLMMAGLWTSNTPARADEAWSWFDSAKFLATGGASEVEGVGGGFANWALITGYGTRDSLCANLNYTAVPLPGYGLKNARVAIRLYDGLELSYAWQEINTENVGALLGPGHGLRFPQNIFGADQQYFGHP